MTGPPPPISIRPLQPQCDWCGEMAPVQKGRSVRLGPAFASGFRAKCPATWAVRSSSTLVNIYLPQTIQILLSTLSHHDTYRASTPRPLLWRADFAQVLSLACRTVPPIRTLSSAHSLSASFIFVLGRAQKLVGSWTRPIIILTAASPAITMASRIAHVVGLTSGVLAGYSSLSLIRDALPPVHVFAEEKVEPAKFPWSHSGWFSSYDHAR